MEKVKGKGKSKEPKAKEVKDEKQEQSQDEEQEHELQKEKVRKNKDEEQEQDPQEEPWKNLQEQDGRPRRWLRHLQHQVQSEALINASLKAGGRKGSDSATTRAIPLSGRGSAWSYAASRWNRWKEKATRSKASGDRGGEGCQEDSWGLGCSWLLCWLLWGRGSWGS